MSFSPTGTLYLIGNVPLDNTYENTIDFTSSSAQVDYFINKKLFTLSEYTYIRKDASIKVGLNFENLYGVNYCMYRNSATSKWIFCFITDKRYVSDVNTEISIETDIMQTFQFNYSIKDSFIEREHQNRWASVGTPLYNVVPENLTLGDDYVREFTYTVASSEKCFLLVTSQALENANLVAEPIQNYPTPLHYYVVPYESADSIDIETMCAVLADNPAVVSASWIPFLPFDISTCPLVNYVPTDGAFKGFTLHVRRIPANSAVQKSIDSFEKFIGYDLPTEFGTGIPRYHNKESKLLTYPYMFNNLTDYQSKGLMLKNEYLEGNYVGVKMSACLSHNPKTKYFIETGYRGETDGKEHALINDTVNDIPLITDAYLNYMQANKNSAKVGMALAGVGAVGSLALAIPTGGLSLALAGGVAMSSGSKIGGELMRQKDLQNVPDSVRSMGNNLSFDMAEGNTHLKFVRSAIHPTIKKVLGDYFAKYGYKCNEVKTPNLKSRYYYNYIKTLGCNIDGDMDNKDLAKLKSIYDNGVTIWHDRGSNVSISYQYDNVEMSLL